MAVEKQKIDLRISKTQQALSSSLLQLLETYTFRKITVNDICKAAMVGRATFYSHFEDKYHLLHFSLEQLRLQMQASPGANRQEQLTRTVRCILEKKSIFRNLFLDEGNQELRRMLGDLFVEDFTREIESLRARGIHPPIPTKPMAIFLSGGVVALLFWWISDSFPVPEAEIVEQMLTLSNIRALPEMDPKNR